ncbi:MAG: hypothetical protein HOI53_03210 [Francisellaceae bacterium]|nr:hypothetical protein [Francisellaceae bacterium]
MSISIVSVEKAIKTRACAYYAAARLIIEYSEAAKSYKVVALVRLNDIIKEFIGVKDVNTEKLKELIAKILGVLQYFHTSALESNISIAEAINHLAHAEHIYNWLFRDKDNIDYVINVIDKKEIFYGISHDLLHTIEHTPIAKFNKTTRDEWLKIKLPKDKKPGWFSELYSWEKKILTAFIDVWVNREELIANNIKDAPDYFKSLPVNVKNRLYKVLVNNKNNGTLESLNLGEFWGNQTGHLACYPSIRNGYRVMMCIYEKSTQEQSHLKLIRKVSLLRTATPFMKLKDEKEQLRITITNIQQAILFDLIYPFRRIARHCEDKSVITIPVLIQNLAVHHKNDDSVAAKNIIIKAVMKLREAFADRAKAAHFLERNIEQLSETVKRDTLVHDANEFLNNIIKNKRIVFSVCFANHEMFSGSFISKKRVPFSQDKKEYTFLRQTIDESFIRLIRTSVMVDNKPVIKGEFYQGKFKKLMESKSPVKAMQELLSAVHEESVQYKVPALKLGLDAYEAYVNEEDASFYKAVYLQLTFSAIGVRIGGCSNGCDFEGPLSLIVNSMRIFYIEHGCLPGCLSLNENENDNDNFEKIIASEFLQGYCHNVLEISSQGCSGLISLEKTLGISVLDKIKKLAPEYGIDPDKCDFYGDADILSKLECLNDNLDGAKFEGVINVSLSETENLERTKNWNEHKDSKLHNRLLIPKGMLEKNKKRVKAEEEIKKKCESEIESRFNISSMEELYVEMDRASKETPLQTTFMRLKKFRSKKGEADLKKSEDDS